MTITEKLRIFDDFLILYNHDYVFLDYLLENSADVMVNLELLATNKEIFSYLQQLYLSFI